MPIIKASSKGELLTTVIFNEQEIKSLVHLLASGSFNADDETYDAVESLQDMLYAFAIDVNYV